MESAAGWRRRAERLVRQGRFAEAADAYRREAALYRRLGDHNAAEVEDSKADRWSSELRLFVQGAGSQPAVAPAPPARWEPPYGCYLGAFLDRDERLGEPFRDENGQAHRDPALFGQLTGRKLASVFCYLSYGQRFPSRWVARLKAQGIAPHIAWEPNRGLAAVQDDAYLRGFADDAARADCPLFLRFAGEMNGDWTRYGGDPLRYKTAWGIIRRVMARRAPNVALVWCVNAIPQKPIPLFYPGDASVDWVGVNFYSVPFYDNDPARSGEWANPVDRLRHVYRLYAARKPLMVCEWSASHLSAVDQRDRSDWAALKIAQLYAALPRLYPRVKLVNIFDNDNLTYARPGRQLNNYSVTDSDRVRGAYARAVAPDYFLSDIGRRRPPPAPIVPLTDGFVAGRGIVNVSAWARCYVPRPTVSYALDGREVFRSSTPGPYTADLDLSRPGAHRLVATLRDDRGRVAARQERQIIVRT
jgi:hypothetical protein